MSNKDLRSINITILNPCHEPWDAMTSATNGRFCDSCQKTVVDFSTQSDAQLFAFFADPANRNTCGRFLATQINRPINIPHQPHSRLYRMTLAFGLTLIFAQTPHLFAQTAPPLTTQTQRKNQPDINRPDSLIFAPPPQPKHIERKEIDNIITGHVGENEYFGRMQTSGTLRLYSDSMIQSIIPAGIGSMTNENKHTSKKSPHKKK